MNTLFLVTMILEALFGLGFVFLPGVLLDSFGVSLDVVAETLARLFGSALLAFPVFLWYGRRSSNAEFRRALVTGLFVYYLVSLVIFVLTMLARLMNPLGWSVVALHLVLAAGFGLFMRK